DRVTLGRIAELAVPVFADMATVDLIGPDGQLDLVAIRHVDAVQLERVRELRRRHRLDPSHPRGVAQGPRTRCAQLIEQATDELITSWACDDQHLRELRALGMRSYLSTPLVSRGRTIGVLTFLTVDSGRRYGEAERRAAEDLAHRAVVAIENARLYRALQEAD